MDDTDGTDDTFAVHDLVPEEAGRVPFYPFTDQEQPSLIDANVRYFEKNATTVRDDTVRSHLMDIYTPGYPSEPTPRRLSHKRQAPRAGGFPCLFDGCVKTFDRSCDLK
jgi:hypothetical protein